MLLRTVNLSKIVPRTYAVTDPNSLTKSIDLLTTKITKIPIIIGMGLQQIVNRQLYGRWKNVDYIENRLVLFNFQLCKKHYKMVPN